MAEVVAEVVAAEVASIPFSGESSEGLVISMTSQSGFDVLDLEVDGLSLVSDCCPSTVRSKVISL